MYNGMLRSVAVLGMMRTSCGTVHRDVFYTYYVPEMRSHTAAHTYTHGGQTPTYTLCLKRYT